MAVSISMSITQNTQSVTNNTTNVTVQVTAKWTYGSNNRTGECTGSITIDGKDYDFSGIKFNTGQTTSGSQTIMTKTVNVSHNSDGTKKLSCSASFVTGVSSGTVTATASKTLTTIPRKSTLSVANGTLRTEQTLTITEQASAFTHKIAYFCGDKSGWVLGSGETDSATSSSSALSVKWTPPLSLATENTTGTSVSIKFNLYTYTGSSGKLVGLNTYTKTFSIPASVKPSCSISVTDPTGYADTYGVYLKGLSQFKVVVTPTTAHGSAIASYSTTANGSNYTSASFTTGVLKSSGTLAINATVKDKRGRSGSASVSKEVFDYAAPSVSKLIVRRCNADGTENDQGGYVQVTMSASAKNINDKNKATFTLKWKKTSASSYTSVVVSNSVFSLSNSTYIFEADTESAYDVALTVSDGIKTITATTSASTAFSLMHFSKGGTGMGIGKLAEEENLLDIGIPIRLRKGIVQNVLWSGSYYMTDAQTANLSGKVSEQSTGIVLVFSRYDIANSEYINEHFCYHFVPKQIVALQEGKGSIFTMSTSNETFAASKYLYISDTSISGHANNTATGTGDTGVNYNNNRFVLRYVIGV